MSRLIPAQERAARVTIKRLGERCTLSEPGDVVEDGYGKGEIGSWPTVGEEYVVRVYRNSHSNEPELERTTGGRYPSDKPLIIFMANSAVDTGMRVDYLTETYEIDAITPYRTHLEAKSTLVEEEE